jgi:trehalose-6-phosphatase
MISYYLPDKERGIMSKVEDINQTQDDKKPTIIISGNGVVHVRASELSKSKQVREMAQEILDNKNYLLQN